MPVLSLTRVKDRQPSHAALHSRLAVPTSNRPAKQSRKKTAAATTIPYPL